LGLIAFKTKQPSNSLLLGKVKFLLIKLIDYYDGVFYLWIDGNYPYDYPNGVTNNELYIYYYTVSLVKNDDLCLKWVFY
jgi:hypothetical protein